MFGIPFRSHFKTLNGFLCRSSKHKLTCLLLEQLLYMCRFWLSLFVYILIGWIMWIKCWYAPFWVGDAEVPSQHFDNSQAYIYACNLLVPSNSWVSSKLIFMKKLLCLTNKDYYVFIITCTDRAYENSKFTGSHKLEQGQLTSLTKVHNLKFYILTTFYLLIFEREHVSKNYLENQSLKIVKQQNKLLPFWVLH